jgi:hypothetical protein
VRDSGTDPARGSVRLCNKCIEIGYYQGEIVECMDGHEFVN